ncbi:helix-turn-helix domain-containing protein [Bythopirellula polymerisocia]|uniref:Helix-turn-helix domain protein n=1 Tax=Bythopirellula polymerisocia TaxID=2528003 RepID=A0A5C6CSU7_9BACT|nr:helix-turn-helix domain-containing protein [Bythopirellula polymerisocia]TWU27602.1 Helix-turn-helix domain protein [Bythopirellula polymerisocia]
MLTHVTTGPSKEVESEASPLMTEDQAAIYMGGVSKKHLYNLRRDCGLPFVPVGSRIMYRREALDAWCRLRERRSTK